MMKLKMRHLDVFDALFNSGSVSRAAQRLNLTQPAVSLALSSLEKQLGFTLFHRERGFFAPTNEALMLYEEVQKSMDALSRLNERADGIRSGKAGAIRIGTNGTLAFHFLPRLIYEFQREYPDVYIDIKLQASRQISSWVASRQIDIGLIDTPVPVVDLNAHIYALKCVCIMHADDPLSQLTTIHPKHLDKRQIVAITGSHNVDRQLQTIMSKAEIELNYKVSCFYFSLARRLVASGEYLALVDPINGSASMADDVISRPFHPSVFHELAVITSRKVKPDKIESQFLKIINDRLSAYTNA